MQFLTALIALLKAVPAIKGWWDQLVVWYINREISSMREELQNAIYKISSAKDQRDLEKYLGSPRAGEPSGVSGSEIVSDLPGVPSGKLPDAK
jgi:hypothetical protein